MNESVSVSASALIRLRRSGESLTLPLTHVRAKQAGTYLSHHKGRGMEFEEHRLYQPGDDVRSIDWRVTARTGTPHTKLFREERERPVLFCVDFRRPMHFATRGVFKSVAAARATALLAWSSVHHGDRVGGLIFSETHHQELRPQRGSSAVLKLIRGLAQPLASDQRDPVLTTMEKPMMRLRRVARPGSQIFVVSDFRGWNEPAETQLIQIARHNSVWLLHVSDPIEIDLPPAGVYKITDGAKQTFINTRGRRSQDSYSAQFSQRQAHLGSLCRRFSMSLIQISTQSNLPELLRSEIAALRPAGS